MPLYSISADSHVTEPGDCYLPRIDPRFRARPMILETAKEEGDEQDMDAINLATLRGLVGAATSPP